MLLFLTGGTITKAAFKGTGGTKLQDIKLRSLAAVIAFLFSATLHPSKHFCNRRLPMRRDSRETLCLMLKNTVRVIKDTETERSRRSGLLCLKTHSQGRKAVSLNNYTQIHPSQHWSWGGERYTRQLLVLNSERNAAIKLKSTKAAEDIFVLRSQIVSLVLSREHSLFVLRS